MANITDLKGTTWKVEMSFTCPSSIIYDVGGAEYTKPDNLASDNFVFDQFRVGYYNNTATAYNGIEFYNSVSEKSDYLWNDSNFGYICVTFATGTDLTSSSLISWLYENGELLYSASDTSCENTVWTISSPPSGSPSDKYSMNGSVTKSDGSSMDFTEFAVGYGRLEAHGFDGTEGSICSFWNGETKEYLNVYSTSDFLPLTISFSAGISASHPSLISWLKEYGKQFDLEDTTWYVPSGWSHPSNTIYLGVLGRVKYGVADYDFHFISIKDTAEIGFYDTLEEEGRITNSTAFTISFFDGATDNISLISWLKANGTMLKVTDLTDTTWNVNVGWEAEAGYGHFLIIGVLNQYYNSEELFTVLGIGYNVGSDNDADGRVTVAGDKGTREFDPTESLVFAFTDGTDATNPSLIAWLSKYGELQQTLTLINMNNESETATYTVSVGTTFADMVSSYPSQFNTGGSDLYVFYVPEDSSYVRGFIVKTAENIAIDVSTLASGTFYYEGKMATYELSGTWVFNETIDLTSGITESGIAINFETAGYSCTKMYKGSDFDSGDAELCYTGIPNNFSLAYHSTGGHDGSKGWQNEAYRTVTFDGTQTVSQEFYEWFTANAVKQEEEETPTEYGEIHYNGSLLATIQLGQTVILHTEGLQAIGDIVIKNVGEAVDEETPTLISFTIDGETYQAEEGMAWIDWCVSDYNTINLVCSLPLDPVKNAQGKILYTDAGVTVYGNEGIINSQPYTFTTHSGGTP